MSKSNYWRNVSKIILNRGQYDSMREMCLFKKQCVRTAIKRMFQFPIKWKSLKQFLSKSENMFKNVKKIIII